MGQTYPLIFFALSLYNRRKGKKSVRTGFNFYEKDNDSCATCTGAAIREIWEHSPFTQSNAPDSDENYTTCIKYMFQLLSIIFMERNWDKRPPQSLFLSFYRRKCEKSA